MSHDTIELVVDEPVDGHFYWILQKHSDSDTDASPVEAADGPLPTYSAAMMAGIAALQRRADARSADCAVPMVTVFVDPHEGRR